MFRQLLATQSRQTWSLSRLTKLTSSSHLHLHPRCAVMASTVATDSPTPPTAPWRSLFVEHLQGMKMPLFTLSTLRRINTKAEAQQQEIVVPRARTCVWRGMWASLPPNDKNDAPLNPPCYESDLPVFTTDARMDKLVELLGPDHIGGGPVEAVWWAETPMVQWRVRARAYVLGSDDIEKTLLKRMRRVGSGHGDWSFEREVTAHFGNLSPGMRGTFRNPAPGTPVTVPVDGGSGLGLGQKVTDLYDEVARRNFRVVVLVPFEVDRTDLSDPERGRRWVYYRLDGDGDGWYRPPSEIPPGGVMENGWVKVEVWP